MTGEKILLVGGDFESLARIESIAEKAGAEVCHAASAEEAWSLLMAGDVTAMLVSSALPGENGETLAGMAHTFCPNVTVVMVPDLVAVKPDLVNGKDAARGAEKGEHKVRKRRAYRNRARSGCATGGAL